MERLIISVFAAIFVAVGTLSFEARAESGRVLRILMPLEGFLIQKIPIGVRQKYEKSFSVYMEKKGGSDYYAVRPNASAFLKKMREKGIQVYFVSNLDQETESLLVELSYAVGNFDHEQRSRFILRSNLPGGRYALAALPGGKKDGDLIVVTSQIAVARSDRNQVYDAGRGFHYFSSYEEAKTQRSTAKKNHHLYPKTRSDWERDANRIASLYFYLERREAGVKTADSLSEVARDLGVSEATIFEQGIALLKDNASPVAYSWSNVSGKIGCRKIEFLENKKELVPISDCLARLPISYKFEAGANNKVGKCVAITREERARSIPFDVGVEPCLAVTTVHYAWEDPNRTSCASFVPAADGLSSLRIRAEEVGKCSDHFSKTIAKTGKVVLFSAFEGWDKLTPTELDDRVLAPRPDERNLERLWYPNDDLKVRTTDLATCMDSSGDGGEYASKYGHMKEDAKGNLLPHCQPDTLYSWGDEKKFEILRDLMSGDAWKPIRALYTTPGAVTTFNYGPIPLRIKLRPDVKFRSTSSHHSCRGDKDEEANTVYYRKDEYKDWVICSAEVIESWSHSMPQHYDEIVKDLREHRRNPGPENVIYYYNDQNSQKTIFTNFNLNGRSGFSEEVLRGFLQGYVQRVRAGKGEVFYNPKTPVERRTVEAHFGTKRPLYFNER